MKDYLELLERRLGRLKNKVSNGLYEKPYDLGVIRGKIAATVDAIIEIELYLENKL